MENRKNLVIFVADYPFGTGEPFLEEEIKILENDFEKIFFVHTSLRGQASENFKLYTPKNAEIVNLYPSNFAGSWFKKALQLFSFSFLFEIFLAKNKHHKKFSLKILKLISHYWVSSTKGKKAIEYLIKKNKIVVKDTLFYSYWCDIHALSLARLNKSNSEIKFITRLHGWDLYFERHENNFLPFRELIFNQAEKILPISNDGRKYILNKKLSIHPEKIITSRLGVDNLLINKNYPLAIDQSNVPEKLIILTLSHINPVKRLDRFIEAIKVVKGFDIQWYHIGYGYEEHENKIKKLAFSELENQTNISFNFLGQFTKTEVKNFLQIEKIDIIVNCSDTEGIPVSLMEAMSAGIPAIAFNIGGIPGIVSNNENGFLLDFETENANILKLSASIEKFYYLPSEEKNRLSHNAKLTWQEKFDQKNNFNHLSELLKYKEVKVKNEICCQQCLISSAIYPKIVLNKYGICDVCEIVEDKNAKIAKQKDSNYLDTLLSEIKSNPNKKQYDCILGISGGIDSAYLALKVKEWGLNPLLVHIDNGWNSETAVFNIQTLIKHLGFELYTVVINWEEIKDVVRSFLKASVIDIDWANEMCAQAALNKVAHKFGVKYVLTGHQMATEGWMPDNVVHYKLDSINFKAIHRKFGSKKLKTYPIIGFLKTYYYEKILGIKFYYPLDYIEYNKDKVRVELVEKYGWRDYGQKHFENIFTRFYQGFILIKKFKIDKRKFHYSSSILSGQMTKDQANKLIESNEYQLSGQLEEDKEYVMKKLEFSPEEFEEILNAAPKNHTDYPSIINVIKKLKKVKNVIQNNK